MFSFVSLYKRVLRGGAHCVGIVFIHKKTEWARGIKRGDCLQRDKLLLMLLCVLLRRGMPFLKSQLRVFFKLSLHVVVAAARNNK